MYDLSLLRPKRFLYELTFCIKCYCEEERKRSEPRRKESFEERNLLFFFGFAATRVIPLHSTTYGWSANTVTMFITVTIYYTLVVGYK